MSGLSSKALRLRGCLTCTANVALGRACEGMTAALHERPISAALAIRCSSAGPPRARAPSPPCCEIGSIVSFSGCSRMWSALAEEALDRRLLPEQRHDDVAIAARCPASARRRSRPRGCRRPSSSRRESAAGTRPSPPPAISGTETYSSTFSSASIGCPAATEPTQRQAVGAHDPAHAPRAADAGRAARSPAAWTGPGASRPIFSRLARCACTVEDEASPTALPMSRTVGG